MANHFAIEGRPEVAEGNGDDRQEVDRIAAIRAGVRGHTKA